MHIYKNTQTPLEAIAKSLNLTKISKLNQNKKYCNYRNNKNIVLFYCIFI